MTPSDSSTSPVVTSSAPTLGYPSYTGSEYPTFTGPGFPVESEPIASKAEDDYPVGKPSITSEPTYATSKPIVTTTCYTTTYIDLCSTGFTTATATVTKTYTACHDCEAPKPTSNEVPEGWYTTIAVCGNCGPRTTTVTLTKPYATPTEASYEVAQPSGAAYPPQAPSEGEEVPNDEEVPNAPSKSYVTLVPVPTSASPAAPPPSYAGNHGGYDNSHASGTVPSGKASSTGAPVYTGGAVPSYGVSPPPPAQYEGAASRFSVGVSGVFVVVVGALLL